MTPTPSGKPQSGMLHNANKIYSFFTLCARRTNKKKFVKEVEDNGIFLQLYFLVILVFPLYVFMFGRYLIVMENVGIQGRRVSSSMSCYSA